MSTLSTASAPNTGVNGVALAVLIVLFLAVTVMGFLATRWRQAESMESLDEWGLGGRGFGTWVTWFLLGGDLYTAYTFVAVPAAMFALGSVSGFFAVPYTIVVYPIIFVFMSRLWSVSHRHGYVTAADFVRGRYGSRGLSLAVAVTGILATMPYIALQLVGIEAVLEVIGLGGNSAWRGPAAVHRVRGAGGLHLLQRTARSGAHRVRQGRPDLPGHHRRRDLPAVQGTAAGATSSTRPRPRWPRPNPATGKPTGAFIPGPTQYWAYGTLALGSALALFMYPHSVTAVLSSKSRDDDPAQRGDPAGVQLRAGPAGAARLGRHRGRHQADRAERQAQRAAGHPPAVRGLLPVLVRRRRLRRGRDRRARPGGDHVDRGGEPLHPQHLPGVDPPERDGRRRRPRSASWSRCW